MPAFFIDPDISKAKTIDTAFYNSEKYYQLSKERIFSKSIQYTGCKDDIPEAGGVYPLFLLEHFLDEPLLLVNDKDDGVLCLSNVCTHRGNLLVKDACTLKKITCRYHGRQFSISGKFISMPQFDEVKNFPSSDDNLPRLPVFTWGNLIFTALDAGVDPEKFLGEMKKRMDWFPMDKLKFRKDLSRQYKVKASWALYCENYLEGFHIPFVHAGLNAVLDFSSYTTELFSYSNLQTGIAKDGEDAFVLPATSADYGKNIAAYYFWVFPNMMFNFYPWGLSLNIVKPISVHETTVAFYSFVIDESKLNSGAGHGLDKVELEDEEIVENVQRGVKSRFYNRGRYSVTKEQGTHHFHRLISEFIG